MAIEVVSESTGSPVEPSEEGVEPTETAETVEPSETAELTEPIETAQESPKEDEVESAEPSVVSPDAVSDQDENSKTDIPSDAVSDTLPEEAAGNEESGELPLQETAGEPTEPAPKGDFSLSSIVSPFFRKIIF